MSKGSKRRPGDSEKYRENWDRIFGEVRNDDFFVKVLESTGYAELAEKCRKDCDEAIKNALRQGFSEKLTADIGDNDPRRFVATYGEEGLQPAVWWADSPGSAVEGTTVLTVAKLIELVEWADKNAVESPVEYSPEDIKKMLDSLGAKNIDTGG